MLALFSKRILTRQTETFPTLVAKLEALRDDPDPRKTAVLKIAALVAHDLRNQLTIIGVVLELDAEKERAKVLMDVLKP